MRFIQAAVGFALMTSCFFATATTSTFPPHPKRIKSFSCPLPMTYSPWIKACSCSPGQSWNANSKKCKGTKLVGAWPEPKTVKFEAAADYELSSFCASSPTNVVPYDPAHGFCKAGVGTLAFVASKDIVSELEELDTIDYESPNISKALKDVGAGLSGLYVEDVNDAVALFNTNKFGLGTLIKDLLGNLPSGIINVVKNITCLLKPRSHEQCTHDCDEDDDCNHDCVAFATKGCGNFLDGIVGGIGDLLERLSGLCIVDGVLELVGEGGELVSCVTDDLLGTVGIVLGGLLDLFDCNCEK
jgi:hypothetical protein